jgi:predicted nucleic acid-binding Zn ribbon protein
MIQILFFVFTGIILLWFGYTLFFAFPQGFSLPIFGRRRHRGSRGNRSPVENRPGAPRTCPVCSTLLEKGERVKSEAFPTLGGPDRLMHISGCFYCLEGDQRRNCPVCGAGLRKDEFLIARLFEKPSRSHVHVLGCTRCKTRRV